MTKRILAVDDSRMVRDLLEFMLRGAGYEVDTAEDGSIALDLISTNEYALALIDLNMPLMDGYTLIERIRADPALEGMAIIIVTTEAEAEDRRRGIEAGADLYMVKPVEEAELIANIQMLVGKPNG